MGRVGIEPTTLGLKGPCSTAELPARRNVAAAWGPINASTTGIRERIERIETLVGGSIR